MAYWWSPTSPLHPRRAPSPPPPRPPPPLLHDATLALSHHQPHGARALPRPPAPSPKPLPLPLPRQLHPLPRPEGGAAPASGRKEQRDQGTEPRHAVALRSHVASSSLQNPAAEKISRSRQLGFPASTMPRSGGGGGVKVTPNLSVLQGLDPAVTDILTTAAHVTAYNYDADTKQWSRKPVRGSLFVVKRNAQPIFQVVVMNSLNTENLVKDLPMDFKYKVEDGDTYVMMYRNASDGIIRISFYNQQECREVVHLFSRMQDTFSKASPEASQASKSEFEDPDVGSAVPPRDKVKDGMLRLAQNDIFIDMVHREMVKRPYP